MDDEMKRGSRNNSGDRGRLAEIKASCLKAVDLVHEMEPGLIEDLTAAQMEGHSVPVKADLVVELPEMVLQWVTVKAAGDWTLEVLGVPFGGPFNGKDSDGEFFSAKTNTYPEFYREIPAVYYHGFTPEGQPAAQPVVIGKAIFSHTDGQGHWYKVFLDKMGALARRVWEAAKAGTARASSGSVAHLVRKAKSGEILDWPVAELSIFDVEGKRQPANPYAVVAPVMKAHYESAHLTWTEQPEPGSGGFALGADVNFVESRKAEGFFEMDEKELLDLLDKRDAAKAAQAAEAAKVSEVEGLRRENEALKAAAAKGNRLPTGAPHQARFGAFRRYDNLEAADLALGMTMLKSAGKPVSAEMQTALVARVAEDKTPEGAANRRTLKGMGINAEDAVNAAKANELDYSTQANYGDEFVPSVWSSNIWELVRLQPGVLAKFPAQEFTGPGDTFPIPLESGDPTWYTIGQATDLNATTGRPDATIGDSKLGTAKKDMTFTKIGARVPYSGEMDEDSIIPWLGQLRGQMTKSFAEQMEHMAIDGDTATGATTNVNHIGGTPTSTGTKRDLFLGFDGPRKLALVTNTANSLSAAGTLTDTLFLQILQLMGAAGTNAIDRAKVEFIIDLNVAWKAAQLAQVKTKDVFTQATIEGGLLSQIYGYKVNASGFMHWKSAVRKANTAGKVDQTTVGNNTTGAILAVRFDQWMLGYKRNMIMKLQDIPDSDAQQLIATARLGLIYRDTEAASIAYNVGV